MNGPLRKRNLDPASFERVPHVRQDTAFHVRHLGIISQPRFETVLDAGVFIGLHEGLWLGIMTRLSSRVRMVTCPRSTFTTRPSLPARQTQWPTRTSLPSISPAKNRF